MRTIWHFLSLGLLMFASNTFAQSTYSRDHSSHALSASPTEIATFSEAGSAKFILATIAKCEKIRDRSRHDALPQITHSLDAQGRIAAVQYGGDEFSLEYKDALDVKPMAIKGRGFRLPMKHNEPSTASALAAAKTRVLMYRQVRAICGLPQVAQNADWGFVNAGYGDLDDMYNNMDGGVPAEYFDYGFWDSYWEPTYDFALKPSPECVASCQNTCDVVGDLNNVGCAAIGGLVAVGNAGAGIVVGALCGLGVVGGKYVCRSNCEKNPRC